MPIHAWSFRGPALAVACVAAVLLCVSAAAASTVGLVSNPDTGGQVVFYEASAGEVNGLYPYIGLDHVQLQDGIGETGIAISPEAPCVSGQSGSPPPPQPTNFAHCPKSGVDLIAADLGDEDDTFGGMIYSLPVGVAGGSGGDNLYGGSLDDLLFGEEGPDILTGGSGNDLLDGGPGPDRMSGGDLPGYPATYGFDLADYSERLAGVTVTLDGRTNDGEAGEGDYVASDVDDVVGGSGPDALVGSDLANELYGEDGNDAVDGGLGPDLLDGGGGDDTLNARDGAGDNVACGTGVDTAIIDAGDTVAADCESVQRPAVATAPPPAAAAPVSTADSTPPVLLMTVPSGRRSAPSSLAACDSASGARSPAPSRLSSSSVDRLPDRWACERRDRLACS